MIQTDPTFDRGPKQSPLPSTALEALTPVSAALLSLAESEAESILARAAEEARAVVDQARRQAEAVMTEARAGAERAAAKETSVARGTARRRAHELVMSARAHAYQELRRRSEADVAALALRTDYEAVVAALSASARALLGDSAQITVDGGGEPGVVATNGARSVDLRLVTLVDRGLAELGPRVEELWQ